MHAERPGFVGLKPTVIGLIIRVSADHEFDVGAVVIGQRGVPSLAAGPLPQVQNFLPGTML